jgi:Uma2 family endonuclease
MTSAASTRLPHSRLPKDWNLSDLQKHLGGVPLERIRLFPPPGYATEEDVIQIEAREDRLCELEDGILVEKPMGWYESALAVEISAKLTAYLEAHDLGKALGESGSLEILPGVVKIPDVSFVSWERFPQKKLPRRPIPPLVPDLAVEVLSETNTPEEMGKKLKKYFEAGVRLVWYVDPATRSAKAYTSPDDVTEIGEDGVLDAAEVLPGFRLSLREVFAKADRQGPAK